MTADLWYGFIMTKGMILRFLNWLESIHQGKTMPRCCIAHITCALFEFTGT